MTYTCKCGYKTEDPTLFHCPHCKERLTFETLPQMMRIIGKELKEVALEEEEVNDDFKETSFQSEKHARMKIKKLAIEDVDDTEVYKEDVEVSKKHVKIPVKKLKNKKS